jgi:hypothetical protein
LSLFLEDSHTGIFVPTREPFSLEDCGGFHTTVCPVSLRGNFYILPLRELRGFQKGEK